MKTKLKFLKSRRDKKYMAAGNPSDNTVNEASATGVAKHAFGASPFGHSNYGRNASPDAGKSGGTKKQSAHDTNPAGGGTNGMKNPTMAKASARGVSTVGNAQDVIAMKKKKSQPKHLNIRGMQHA